MEIVVTMAGLGSRFEKAGYTVPKYMIEVNGRTLFEWSLMSLKMLIRPDTVVTFVAKEHGGKGDDIKEFISRKCGELNIPQYRVIVIDYLTRGQAATVMLASEYWKNDEELFIYNIDTYVEEGQLNGGQIRGDGFVPCFYAGGTHWSFVRLDETGKAVEVREKERISEHCTLGAYYFKSCGLYEEAYRSYYGSDTGGVDREKEEYVAPLYNWMILNKMEVRICTIDSRFVHVLGTPEELEAFRGSGGMS